MCIPSWLIVGIFAQDCMFASIICPCIGVCELHLGVGYADKTTAKHYYARYYAADQSVEYYKKDRP
jgi:hypothetical protein